jgi:hypothetical protein
MKRFLLVSLVATASASHAQVVFVTPSTYFQNFDTLLNTGTANPWVDNLPAPGMAGWYSNQVTYDADDGTSAISGQYSHGTTGQGDRALGSVALPGALIVYGARLANATGTTLGSLNVDYWGEQWRDGNNAFADLLQFQYSTNATSLSTGTWTSVLALDFNAISTVGAGPVDGNLPAYRSQQVATLTGLNWANGTEMWIRWLHVGNPSRHALAIDEVHLTPQAVPEPATFAALFVGCAALIRRRLK